MRVLHLVKTAAGARWAFLQMRALVELGVEVHVAIPDGPLVADYVRAGVNVHLLQADLPVQRPHRVFHHLQHVRNLVEQVRPDIIHSHFVGTTLAMRLALGRSHHIPRIFQVPGPLHLESPLVRTIELATSGVPDYWIGSCEWTCRLYRQSGVPDERLFLCYHGIDLERFAILRQGKLRAELGLDQTVKIVGMVAFMYPPRRYLGQKRGIKGHEDLIEALAICQRQNEQIVGVFIGGAYNNAHAYEKRVRAYGKRLCGNLVYFLGTRSDVPDLYSDFDVAVHPSHSENLGGALESLLLAVPTITTNVGGFPDLVTHGETGWLVPPRRPDRLAEAILEALGDPAHARHMATLGQGRARSLGDASANARRIHEIYNIILAEDRSV